MAFLLQNEDNTAITNLYNSPAYQKFDEHYFSSETYEDVSFAKCSQYWWSSRFYAILSRRFGKTSGVMLEIG